MNTISKIELKALVNGDFVFSPEANPYISGITLDSRKVRAGDLFVAIGQGKKFIEQAISAGAVAVVMDTRPETEIGVPVVYNALIGEMLGLLLARFYKIRAEKNRITGITGTNGKTSCAHFLSQAISRKDKCGMIGTLGYGELNNLHSTGFTTPNIDEVYRIISELQKCNINNIVMEVSSHALEQDRIAGLEFESVVFTNLTQDHLDYHQNMDEYFSAKLKLFTNYKYNFSVINADDIYGQKIIDSIEDKNSIVSYGINNKNKTNQFVFADSIELDESGISFTVKSSWGEFKAKSHLYGEFNVYNLLAVIAVLLRTNWSVDDVVDVIGELKPVSGRLEDYRNSGYPRVFIDFAHTPDALEKTIDAIKQSFATDVYCVFGCGGERDKQKRPLMGAIASEKCKFVILTDDNPRSEDPQQIINDISSGISDSETYTIIHNRREAISRAIEMAGEEDVVLVAGKGHETVQIIGNECHEFNDAEVVQEVLVA